MVFVKGAEGERAVRLSLVIVEDSWSETGFPPWRKALIASQPSWREHRLAEPPSRALGQNLNTVCVPVLVSLGLW